MSLRKLFAAIVFIGLQTSTIMAQPRYADNSVLATGHWSMIRIPATGFYELTDSLLSLAGISDPSRARLYGYGGAWQPEVLTGDYLTATDDLPQVPVCQLNDGRRLFFANGPVNWDTSGPSRRLRNPYSDYGYYFLTESDEAPLLKDSTTFFSEHYPHANNYHSLYEVDNYAWFHGGRNLFDFEVLKPGVSHKYQLPAYSTSGTLFVSMSYNGYCDADVLVNDSVVGQIVLDMYNTNNVFSGSEMKAFTDQYAAAASDIWTFDIRKGLRDKNTVTIRQTSGADMRLDYISLSSTQPRPFDKPMTTTYPVPEYVGYVANQNHHADDFADMIIIIPASRKLQAEAERLAQLHRDMDGMRVNVVPADELYNEYSSGTPDPNAYCRYVKMLYDRAQEQKDKPRFLVLFGDGAWDNRMLTPERRSESRSDFLLCYESENSFSETLCYVSDDYYCMLDDGEGGDLLSQDMRDVAVGRLPARDAMQAKILVDKIESYRKNETAGAWQNTICLMADDGDDNMHMNDEEWVADSVIAYTSPDFLVNKIYWDVYKKVKTAIGETNPGSRSRIKQQMQNGALIMNYSGHGGATNLSIERVIQTEDFAEPTSLRLPLWVTASCDIMPFNTQEANLGETAMLNPNGGAIAFFGTTHTVYARKNRLINTAFMKYVLEETDGRLNTIGEAVMKAKNYLIDNNLHFKHLPTDKDYEENKLQYTLMGDPALTLHVPTLTAVVDSINGQAVGQGTIQLLAGSAVTIVGHIEDHPDFKGFATVTIRDVEETLTGLINTPKDNGINKPIVFKTRPNIICTGTDSITDGKFKVSCAIPLDISYGDGEGQILVYAASDDRTLLAHGQDCHFTMVSDNFLLSGNGEGPQVDFYLDYEGFQDGGQTQPTPFFYARLSDDDGINASGNGIGHDMELIIDGVMNRTYSLNDYFVYEFGDYRRGEVGFRIPWLPVGKHQLVFRAWDVLNNSTTVKLNFEVVSSSNYSPVGIRNIMNEDIFARRKQTMQGTYYDASGRYIGHQMPTRQGLYIYKSPTGMTKKFVVKGNK